MTGSYNPALVAVSVFIAILASFAALALASRVTAAHGRLRAAWLAGGSVVMGTGMWSMHFVGMLAYRMPVPTAYGVPMLIVSAGAPTLASLLGLWAMARPKPGRAGVAIAGVLMGGAMGAMHYLGMAAMQVPARIGYDAGRVALSGAIAIGASVAAIALGIRFREDSTAAGRWYKSAAAVVMGLAMAGMHYTAMSAARFTRQGTSMRVAQDHVLQTEGLAGAVSIATVVLLCIALLGALVDRRMRARTAETEALRRSKERFRSLVLASAQIVWMADADGGFAGEQRDWGTFTGTPAEVYAGHGWLDAVHPDDRAETAAEWRAALESRGTFQRELRLRRFDGEYRHMLVRGVPVLEPDGSVREWMGAVSDVTDRVREQQGRDFLVEASRVLASSLDYETTLTAVASLAVTGLADWCAVDVVEEDGAVRRVTLAHPDPRRVELARRLEEAYPVDPRAGSGLRTVLRTGRPELVPDVTDEMLRAGARDPEHLERVRELGMRSYVIVPMCVRDQALGAITLVTAESGRRYGAAELHLAEELARRAAVALDNARLFRETEESRVQLEQQAAELEEAQAEMEMAHDELQHANEELQRRTADAERARAAADEANEAKSSFLATMSHELRTPLNAIGGYAQLMEMGIHGPVTEAQAENLEKIRRNQTHLLGLINDILNFAKIEAGHVQYRIERVPVNETLAGLEALVEPQVRAKGLDYAFRPGDPAATACADRERMEQIVLNLLTNAIKFTAPGGRIVMEWEAGGDRVAVRVRDTGRGIPPEKMSAVFEPFVQVDPALTRANEGTGLGLAISRDLARAMGGDLAAESEPDVGSTFTLTLRQGAPLTAAELAALPAPRREAALAPEPGPSASAA